jgi:predicted MFS family arabinose efflux permease
LARGQTPWVVWGIGAGVYVVAMFHRMLLGVSGSEVAARLHVPEGTLGVFVSVQLATYLLMQLPAGLAADRIGPRRTLAAGLACMAAGELLFALAHGLELAIAGRALVGVGDALTFLNVLRLAQAWFPAERQTLLTALTGVAGALGQVASTVPLDAALGHLGLTATFLAIAGVTGALTFVPLLGVRDRPPGAAAAPPHAHEPVLPTLRAAWARAGTRHGFFGHMGLMAPFALTTAVWGVPYLQHTQHMGRSIAASHLLLAVAGFVVTGPLAGLLAARGLRVQNAIVGTLGTTMVAAWATLLLWPGALVPHPVLVVALVAVGAAAAGSMIPFDIARSEAPAVAAGSATAIVNCGGFLSASVGAILIGLLVGQGSPDPVHYQHAMLPILAIAATGLAGSTRLARRRRRAQLTARMTAAPYASSVAS